MTTITTNNVPRQLLTWDELPKPARTPFGYVKHRAQPRFFRYGGDVYDSHTFEPLVRSHWTLTKILQAIGWHSIRWEAESTALLIKFRDDGAAVVVGRAYFGPHAHD